MKVINIKRSQHYATVLNGGSFEYYASEPIPTGYVAINDLFERFAGAWRCDMTAKQEFERAVKGQRPDFTKQINWAVANREEIAGQDWAKDVLPIIDANIQFMTNGWKDAIKRVKAIDVTYQVDTIGAYKPCPPGMVKVQKWFSIDKGDQFTEKETYYFIQ